MFKRAVQEILLHPHNRLDFSDFHHLTESGLIARLQREQERLGLKTSAQLLEGTVHRRLYKVGAVIHSSERTQPLMRHLDFLFRHPYKRRAKEIELCQVLGQRLGRPLQGHEILIDIPSFNKTPEFDLRVFYGRALPADETAPRTFADPEVSRLRDSLLHNFEDQAKIFRIFCIDDPDLRALVGNEAKQYLS